MTARLRGLAVPALHLFVLSAFALAQPLFDILGQTPEFFVVRGSQTIDIVVLALILLVAVPAALLVVELLLGLVSPVAATAAHLAFVAALASLIVMQLLKRAGVDGAAFFAATIGLALVAAALYARRPALRTFLLVLSPAPIVFLALFLANAPLEELSVTDAEAGPSVVVPSRTPVVVVVFDELPTASLMDGERRIDPTRYPSFASLAADATWFRNATTVHEHTTEAVPAILTGRDPHGPAQLPVLSHHPQNLFTLLRRSYAMHVREPVTQLCPPRLCPRGAEPFGVRMSSLGDDLAIVYGHVVLPDEVTQRLPSVTETWQDFGKGHGDDQADGAAALAVRTAKDVDRAVGREMWRNQKFQFEQFVDSIDRTRQPTLYFVHSLLPHSPWRYLPSGRQYGDALGIDGLRNGTWIDDEWLVTQAYQRHLLQLGFVDRLLGRLLRRLRATGLYDRALIVVAADHGASFHVGRRWRDARPATIPDIASVPLIVKRPNQRRSAIVDRAVRTTDILPTIADVLEVDLPRRVAGTSLFDERTDRAVVRVMRRNGRVVSAPAATVERRRDAEVARKVRLFGDGRRSLFAVGSVPRLIGRSVARLPVFQRPAAVEVDGESLLNAVDRRSSLTPSYVRGHIDGSLPRRTPLAIAVNGRIQAVTRSFPFAGQTRFAALVPETAFRNGRNDVQVYTLGPRGGLPLGQLRREAGSTYSLAENEIATSGDRAVPIVPGALEGEVEDWYFERDTIRFGGWAGDVETGQLPDRILVFADDEVVYAGTTSVGRRDLARRYRGLGHSGFVFELPRSLADHDVRLRFFAIQGGRASELAYERGFPWRG